MIDFLSKSDYFFLMRSGLAGDGNISLFQLSLLISESLNLKSVFVDLGLEVVELELILLSLLGLEIFRFLDIVDLVFLHLIKLISKFSNDLDIVGALLSDLLISKIQIFVFLSELFILAISLLELELD